MSDRKYRQRGYMEGDRERERQPKPQAKPQEREGPRSPKMMAFQQKVRCAACGATLQSGIAIDARCLKRRADQHRPHRQQASPQHLRTFRTANNRRTRNVIIRPSRRPTGVRKPF